MASPRSTLAAADSLGTDFWMMFTANYDSMPTLTLFVAGPTATTGSVSIPGTGFAAPFTVTPGAVTSVPIPLNAQVNTSGVVGNLGIHVVAGAEVTVYGLNRIQYTTDAFLGLPTDILGTEYIVLGYRPLSSSIPSEFGIVATQDGTTVTITPTASAPGHPANVPFTVALGVGQTYQLQSTAGDLTGTVVVSDKPVAVFGGAKCTNIPPGYSACDYVVEQLPPTGAWGKQFVTVPLATRLRGDTFRFLAQAAGTVVTVNGVAVATLGRGQYHEAILTAASVVESSQPILVAQYSNGSTFDGVTSDPFQMLIPPYEQFLADYTVTTPATGFAKNYVNVAVPTGIVGQVTLDGVAIPAATFTAIGASGFSAAQLPLTLGSHHLEGPLPFGAFVYGFDNYDSYGYPGGMSLAPVATVTSLTLTPGTGSAAVGTSHCVTATVYDQFSKAVPGVRVDFAVTGANPIAGFAVGDVNGQAIFCWTGAAVGADSIVASVGTITSSASMNWQALVVDSTPPACNVPTAIIAGPPKQVQATVQDADSGIKSIEPVSLTNATMAVAPTFVSGTKEPVVVTFTKVDQTQGSRFVMRVTNMDGGVTVCDPVVAGEIAAPATGSTSTVGCGQGSGGLVSLLGLGLAFLLRRRRAA